MALRKTLIAFLAGLGLFSLAACEELDVVLTYRTPLYVEGAPEALPVSVVAPGKLTAAILTNSGWQRMSMFSELPKRFAVQTGIHDRVQIIMEHRGILDVYPGSLVVIGDTEMSNVSVLQGKCAFMPLVRQFADEYARLSSDAARIAFIESIKKRYLEEKNNMLFVRNPFTIETSFSAQAAAKGRSFSIMIDANHALDFNDFRLDNLRPAFALIRSNAAHGDYRYMAVTGLDIYENTRNLHFSAAAQDTTGNWIKLRTFIPTEAWQYSLQNGQKLVADASAGNGDPQVFLQRYRARLEIKKQDPVFWRQYCARLEQQNRQIGFYWKSQQVLQQSALITRTELVFNKIFSTMCPQKYWRGNFIAPVSGVITSGFGHYRYYYGGFSSVHRAVDIANVIGTPIQSPNAGKIVYVGNTPDRGNNIVIDHGLGVYSCFFHLSEIFVDKDDIVRQGDVIASMGNTGLSTGPHLHWEMVVNGRRVNPLDWMKNRF